MKPHYYLLNVTETYRVDTVDEALAMRDEFDAADDYDLVSFSYTTKINKKTDEEYQVVKAKKVFQTEKELIAPMTVEYIK